MAPTASSCTSTPYTPHRKRHRLPRHDITTVLSHPIIFDLNPPWFGMIVVALTQALSRFIPKLQAVQPARVAVRARIYHEYVLSPFNSWLINDSATRK
jgi:hypothetical protein